MNSPAALIDHIRSEAVSGGRPRPAPNGQSYVVLQVTLKKKLFRKTRANTNSGERGWQAVRVIITIDEGAGHSANE